MRQDRSLLVGVLTAAVVFSACGRKQAPVTPAPQEDTPARSNGNTPPPTTPVRDDEAAARRGRNLATLQEMVFFDYDRSEVRSEAAATLSRKLPVLREEPGLQLRIDGHADERGSIEYNLALGMRRAEAVKAYLLGFGLDASRFVTQSLGEDRPLDRGTTEAAYARNRRAEFTVTAGSLR